MAHPRRYIGVIGPNECTEAEYLLAQEVGGLIARSGAVLVTGGRGGVMEAASRGAKQSGGMTLGILPGLDRADGNPYLDVVIPTGLGSARNAIVVSASDAVIAISGGYGTLSEIGLALKARKTVIGLDTWQVLPKGRGGDPIIRASTAAQAVGLALEVPSP